MMPKKRGQKNYIAVSLNGKECNKRRNPCTTRVLAESLENQLHTVGVFTMLLPQLFLSHFAINAAGK